MAAEKAKLSKSERQRRLNKEIEKEFVKLKQERARLEEKRKYSLDGYLDTKDIGKGSKQLRREKADRLAREDNEDMKKATQIAKRNLKLADDKFIKMLNNKVAQRDARFNALDRRGRAGANPYYVVKHPHIEGDRFFVTNPETGATDPISVITTKVKYACAKYKNKEDREECEDIKIEQFADRLEPNRGLAQVEAGDFNEDGDVDEEEDEDIEDMDDEDYEVQM